MVVSIGTTDPTAAAMIASVVLILVSVVAVAVAVGVVVSV